MLLTVSKLPRRRRAIIAGGLTASAIMAALGQWGAVAADPSPAANVESSIIAEHSEVEPSSAPLLPDSFDGEPALNSSATQTQTDDEAFDAVEQQVVPGRDDAVLESAPTIIRMSVAEADLPQPQLLDVVAQAPDSQPDVAVPPAPLPDNLKDPEVLRQFARDAVKRGDLKQAEEALRRALAGQPADRESSAELGKILLRSDRKSEAMTFLEEATDQFPDDPQLGALLGQAYYVTGNNACAVNWLQWAAGADPWIEDVHFYLGSAYLKEAWPIAAYRTLSIDGAVSDPQIRHAQTLTRGASLQGLRLFGEALCLDQQVEVDAEGTPLAEQARDLQGKLHEAICEPSRFHGTIKFSERYDDLPSVLPTTNAFGQPVQTSDPSWGNLIYAKGSYDVHRGYNDDLTVSAATLHTTNYDASVGNINDFIVQAAYNHRGLMGDTPYTAGALADFDYLMADSDGFYHRSTITPYLAVDADDFNRTTGIFSYSSLEFVNQTAGGVSDPDSDLVSIGGSHRLWSCDKRWAFELGYLYTESMADGASNNYGGHAPFFNVSWQPECTDWVFNFASTMLYRDYQDSFATTGVDRNDDQYLFEVSASHPLDEAKNWFLVLEYYSDRNDSNVGLADYRRQVIDIGIQYNFGAPGTATLPRAQDSTFRPR